MRIFTPDFCLQVSPEDKDVRELRPFVHTYADERSAGCPHIKSVVQTAQQHLLTWID